MSFLESTPPDITESMPGALSARVAADYGDGADWDVSFGGLGFNLAISEQNPYLRGAEQARKEQIDTSTDAGEQSLSSWWTRSQSSWHRGAGVRWYEPGAEPETVHRFGESQGVDVWTPGQVTLLGATTPVGSAGADPVFVSGAQVAGVRGFVRVAGDAVEWVPSVGEGTSGTLAGSGATQCSTAGDVVWVGHEGGVSTFDPATGTTSQVYTCTGRARVWWVKSRVIVAIGPALYEVTPGGSGTVEGDGTELFTHPSPAWVWTDVAEVGGAILAAGFAESSSAVFRFVLEQDEFGLFHLSAGAQVAQMPPGETIHCMGVYLGAHLVLGTSMGVRVGFANEAGDVQYGPLTVETDLPVTDVTFHDRFAYVGVSQAFPDGTSGAARVDLSQEIEGLGRYAWAWDAGTGTTGVVSSVALVGDRVVLAAGNQLFVQGDTPVAEGWLTTGRIRFRTVEPKAFRRARMVAELHGGEVQLTAVDPGGAEHRVVTFGPAFATSSDVAIQAGSRLLNQFLTFRVVLRRSPAGVSPVVSGLVVKAVPAPSRVRLFRFPLMCFDFETDRHGNRKGREGGAFARLAALERLEASGAPVLVVDHRTGEAVTGQVDSVDFEGRSAPDGPSSSFGGVATVTVRGL